MTRSVEELIAGLDVGAAMKETTKGLLVKPLLRTFISDGHLPEVTVRFKNHPLDHAPGDGWFHPSTHPLWAERPLWHYLVEPEKLPYEQRDYSGTMAVTIGSAVGQLFEGALREMGLLPADLQVCHVCPPERKCIEPGVEDAEAGEHGHMDGILALPNRTRGGDILELKTGGRFGSRKMYSIGDLNLEAFKKAWPDYYAQIQSYLRMSEREMAVLLMVELGFPFEMLEIHVPYDMEFCSTIRRKYLDVRQAVADQRPPACMCSSSERKSCAAQLLCGGP